MFKKIIEIWRISKILSYIRKCGGLDNNFVHESKLISNFSYFDQFINWQQKDIKNEFLRGRITLQAGEGIRLTGGGIRYIKNGQFFCFLKILLLDNNRLIKIIDHSQRIYFIIFVISFLFVLMW